MVSSVCVVLCRYISLESGRTKQWIEDSETEDGRPWATATVAPQGLTLRRLMSYIYMEHPFLMFLDHTQRRSTVGRTPLDE